MGREGYIRFTNSGYWYDLKVPALTFSRSIILPNTIPGQTCFLTAEDSSGLPQPAVQMNWTPIEVWTNVTAFLNGWTNFGGTHNSAGYMIDPFKFVHLRGLIKNGTVATTAFILPAGYRPQGRSLFAVLGSGGNGQLTIETTGDVTVTSGNNAYVSLEGVSFRII